MVEKSLFPVVSPSVQFSMKETQAFRVRTPFWA